MTPFHYAGYLERRQETLRRDPSSRKPGDPPIDQSELDAWKHTMTERARARFAGQPEELWAFNHLTDDERLGLDESGEIPSEILARTGRRSEPGGRI